MDSIVAKLRKRGFIESGVDFVIKKNDSVFEAQLDLSQKFDTIYIYHQNLLPDKIAKTFSKGDNLDYFAMPVPDIQSNLKRINKELVKSGDPFIALQLTNIHKIRSNILAADLEINTTKQRTIDKVVIKGYEKFPSSFLKRYLGIKKGMVLDLETIKNKTKAMVNLGFASQKRQPEILFTNDSTMLYLYLSKKPANAFDGFLGFSTQETSNKIQFNGYLNLNLTNNLNYGESIRFVYKSDKSEQRTISVDAELPYLFKTPIGLTLGLNIFKQDSTFSSVGQSAKLFYQINHKIKLYSGLETASSSSLLENSNSLVDDFKSTFYSVSLEYRDRTESLLFPIHNHLIVGGNFGKRNSHNSTLNQTALFYKAYKIFNLNNKNSIYINSEGKALFSDNYLNNELYRFGGINSIRGFNENSLYASFFSVVNTEYRYLLSSTLYANTILDAAYYENNISNTSGQLYSVGIGMGMATKSGLLKLIIANGQTKGQNFKLNNAKVHISLSTSF